MLSPDDLDFQAAVAGQYSLDRELGRGGMGIVYLAREVLLDRPVAIKRLPPEYADDADARARFIREAKTAAQLFHPNIVPIHRVDSLGRFVFFAMGYVDGETVGQLVRRRGPLPVTEATRILRDAAYALGYGHARGVVHRDVKPDNLLIEKGSGRTLVTDFGIAQQSGASGLTRDGQLLGSVHYMSPEQIGGQLIDGRSDVYALGALAHFMLVGKPPFDNAAATAVLGMHLSQPAPPIAALARGVPQRLAAAIDRCLAKDPSARFATADELAEALTEVGSKRSVPAPMRAWTKGAGLLDPGLFIVGAIVFVAIASTQNFWLLGVPLAYATLQRLRITRRLLASGYDASDLSAALVAEIEHRSEEAASQFDRSQPAYIRPLRLISIIAAATAIGSMAFLLYVASHLGWAESNLPRRWGDIWENVWIYSTMVAVGGGLITEMITPSRALDRVGGADLGWRLRFWRSPAGSLLAKMLRRGTRQVAHADADRPTEVIVGGAAASLFDALPRAVRKEFARLPQVVSKLESRARDLRARRTKMEMLASVAAKPMRSAAAAPAVDQLRAKTVDDFTAARQSVDQQLATTIAALETIRLDLLRLHAGRGSTADLTAALTEAASIGDDVAASLAGLESVERLVASP